MYMDEQDMAAQIMDRAREEAAEHRARVVHRRWNNPVAWGLPLLVIAMLFGFISISLPMPYKLALLVSGMNEQRPDYSYVAGTVQLPLEARMVGIYSSFLITTAVLLVQQRWGARFPASRPVGIALAVFFLIMIFDSLNSRMTPLDSGPLHPVTNVLGLGTGLLAGIAVGVFLLWITGRFALPSTSLSEGTTLRVLPDLVILLVLNAAFGAMVLAEQPTFYYPIALMSTTGLVVALSIAWLLVIMHLSGLSGRVTRAYHLVTPASLALIITFIFLLTMALLRTMVSEEHYPFLPSTLAALAARAANVPL
jgi:uncharacterized membrane protein